MNLLRIVAILFVSNIVSWQALATPAFKKVSPADANAATIHAKEMGVEAFLNNSKELHRATAAAYRKSALMHSSVKGKLKAKHSLMSAADKKAATDHDDMATDIEAAAEPGNNEKKPAIE